MTVPPVAAPAVAPQPDRADRPVRPKRRVGRGDLDLARRHATIKPSSLARYPNYIGMHGLAGRQLIGEMGAVGGRWLAHSPRGRSVRRRSRGRRTARPVSAPARCQRTRCLEPRAVGCHSS